MSSYMDNKMFLSPTVSQYGSHMVMSNVMKETKTKCINLDTKYCDEYVNNVSDNSNPNYNLSNYVITLPEKINNVKSMKVESVEIPNVMYNISSSQGNNYFKLTINGVSKMIRLKDGYYTIPALNNEMNILINPDLFFFGACKTFAVSGNYKSFFYSTLNNGTIDFAVSSDGSFDKNNLKSKLGWILGFRNTSYTIQNIVTSTVRTQLFPTYPPITTNSEIINYYNMVNLMSQSPYNNYFISSENHTNLNTTKYFYLIIDEYCNGKTNSFYSSLPSSLINKNIIAKLIISSSFYLFGSMANLCEFNGLLFSDRRTYNGKVDIQKLNIQLANENGEIINLSGFDFSLSLKLEYE
jgi:hypothetical protein